MASSNTPRNLVGVWFCLIYLTTQCVASTHFSSHVSINTPAHSFSHGVGNPVGVLNRGRFQHKQPQVPLRSLWQPSKPRQPLEGYPRVTPTIPFKVEEIPPKTISVNSPPWQQRRSNAFLEHSLPILPPSPYKVDSPDPESSWPEGLFLPPLGPSRFQPILERRSDTGPFDHYLREGTEAIAAVKRADRHGHLFFQDIPHIESLLANQEIRVKNNLKPHRIASIRHTWPYNRP
ncbi:hypothetical protein K1T71_005154 [Dendrolimus kikuchii]|uniref:Uncharacterized protein n=1 Tax=Dendrolimus kikuchii TaxID=765133 RepID=A0ACC1D7B6_9NEOP|nr:hypothetical protein K1T71_005154 [Dendrolimus kikuchii]